MDKVATLPKGPVLGARHLQAALLFVYITLTVISRHSVSVSIVAMTNSSKSNPDFPEYKWNEKEKNYIISSLYWGTTITQMLGAYWLRRFGVKMTLFFCTLVSGLLSLVVPYSVSWGGWEIFCVIRFLQGIAQCIMLSGAMQHLAKWSPPTERTRLGGFIISGFEVGTIIGMGLTGWLATGPWGWPGLFYVSAIISFVWCGFWLVFGADDASKAKFISRDERAFIDRALEESIADVHKKKIPTPWRAIWTSKPFWALLIATFAQDWCYCILIAELPLYLNGALDMEIGENALWSAMIFLGCALMTYVFIFSADVIMKRKWMSLTVLRKSFNSFSMWIPAAGLVWFSFLGPEEKTFALILMAATAAINSAQVVGNNLGVVDFSPNHAGTLSSLQSTSAYLALFLAPLFVGQIVDDERDRSQWQIVFIVSAVVFCVGDLAFLIWGTGKQQPWNEPDFLLKKDEERLSNGNSNGQVLLSLNEMKPLNGAMMREPEREPLTNEEKIEVLKAKT